MAKIPASLLDFRTARHQVTEFVIRMLMPEYLCNRAPERSNLRVYAERVKRHFENHPAFRTPQPEMIAAVDLFFNWPVHADGRKHSWLRARIDLPGRIDEAPHSEEVLLRANCIGRLAGA
jgi:hypothetical protein